MSEQIDLGFDPDELREKYRQERDKRVRAEANDQYIEVKGDFAHYIDDPYLDEVIEREALTDEVDVVVIGGGFGGLLAGARLREAGVESIRMIEKGGEFGGTWYWNRYPGAACDIESYVYLPLLEEVGYMPRRKYASGAEIRAYTKKLAQKFDLYRDVCFQTEVTEVRWQEEQQRWLVVTNRGDQMLARFVAMSNGPLNRPKLPGIAGIDRFKGHTFHTSRWDYEYTGGTAEGNLEGLKGKRVGIIGTGATAVQCVPHLGAAAGQLYVFQRTPSSIDVRADQATDEAWFNSLPKGWHQQRMDNFNILVSGGVQAEDLVNDGWTEIIRNLLFLVQSEDDPDLSPAALSKKMELADFQKMESIRARAQELVEDPNTAESLKPYYRQFCKRPCFHDDYLPTFNRPNVTLVDTKGQGVTEITDNAVVAGGEHYEVDCIIFATGFEVGTGYTRRSGYELYGRDGVSLSEKWADGVKTLHGMHSHGFPNCFIMGNTQTAFTANYPHALNEQSIHLAYIVQQCLAGNHKVVEALPEAEEAWVQEIIELARVNIGFLESCTPGYYNNEGKPTERALQNSNYGAGPVKFFERMADWRAEGQMSGLKLG